MIAAFGGFAWWPLNGEVCVLRGAPDQVCRALNPTGRGLVAEHAGLDAALAALAPFGYGVAHTRFLVATKDGGTLVLASGAPAGGLLHGLSGTAERDLHCESIAAAWVPRQPRMLASAGFDHFRPSAYKRGSGPRSSDDLTLQVSDQDRRWEFTRIPPGPQFGDRPYEEPEHYRARRVADRLPLDLIRRYLAAAGIPVDDPHYAGGPVLTLAQPFPVRAEQLWSTIEELRALAGYPNDGIPTDLRRAPSAD